MTKDVKGYSRISRVHLVVSLFLEVVETRLELVKRSDSRPERYVGTKSHQSEDDL